MLPVVELILLCWRQYDWRVVVKRWIAVSDAERTGRTSVHTLRIATCWMDADNNAAVTTAIRLRFDGRSTAYQRSLRSEWRHPLAAVTLIYLFIYAAVYTYSSPVVGPIVGRRLIVAQSNCIRMGVERRSNCSQVVVCNHRLKRTSRVTMSRPFRCLWRCVASASSRRACCWPWRRGSSRCPVPGTGSARAPWSARWDTWPAWGRHCPEPPPGCWGWWCSELTSPADRLAPPPLPRLHLPHFPLQL